MKKTVIIVSLLFIGFAGGWVILKSSQAPSSEPSNGEISVGQVTHPHPKGQAGSLSGNTNTITSTMGSGGITNARPDWSVGFVDDANLSDADKQQLEKLQAALDAEDLNGVTSAARQLMRSESVAARQRLASALGWFGAAALPEMIEMMGDSNPEVVDAITTSTLEAIAEMEDGEEKANLLAALLQTMTDLDAIDDALMLFASMDNEIVIPRLSQLIEGAQGNPARRAVLEDYFFFSTGERYVSAQ